MRLKYLIQPVLFVSLIATSFSLQAQDLDYKFIKKIPLEGNGKWDYIKMDGEAERLFVSHFDQVHVIDLITEKEVGAIKNLKDAHGIAFARAFGLGYITNSLNNTVTVFDYKTLKTVKTIAISGKKPDAIIFETFTKQIIVFCGDSKNAIIIDVTKNEETGKIDLGGAPEFAVFDGKGIIYNNLEDKNEVVAIDITKKVVVKRFALTPNLAPTGIAIDHATGRLFVACKESQTLAVLKTDNGEIVANLPLGKGTDAVIFEATKKIVVASNADGTATLIKQKDADHYEVIQTLKTSVGSKTMVHRASTRKLYMSAANKRGNVIQPGTFGVSVYGPVK